jgi:hypothetical protein
MIFKLFLSTLLLLPRGPKQVHYPTPLLQIITSTHVIHYVNVTLPSQNFFYKLFNLLTIYPLKEIFHHPLPQLCVHSQMDSSLLCCSANQIYYIPLTAYWLPYIKLPKDVQPTHSSWNTEYFSVFNAAHPQKLKFYI